jgi:hypothetical protein
MSHMTQAIYKKFTKVDHQSPTHLRPKQRASIVVTQI